MICHEGDIKSLSTHIYKLQFTHSRLHVALCSSSFPAISESWERAERSPDRYIVTSKGLKQAAVSMVHWRPVFNQRFPWQHFKKTIMNLGVTMGKGHVMATFQPREADPSKENVLVVFSFKNNRAVMCGTERNTNMWMKQKILNSFRRRLHKPNSTFKPAWTWSP